MKKIAILLAEGYEEGEVMFAVDIFRRGGLQCDLISVTQEMRVKSCNNVIVEADRFLGDDVKDGYDVLMLPGGQPGAENLKKVQEVLDLVRHYINKEGKLLAAVCSAPIVLQEAGVLKGKRITSYPSEKYISQFTESEYIQDEMVVIDGNLITSRGPVSVLPFAYKVVEMLGIDSAALQKRMQYTALVSNIRRNN